MLNQKYFVKFVNYNQNTLSSLINNTVKFSTVYEFNDFNELRFIAPSLEENPNDHIVSKNTNKEIRKRLEEYLNSPKRRSELFQKMYNSGGDNREYLRKFEHHLCHSNNFKLDDVQELKRCLLANAVFSSVGILCLANINVFSDDSAQLMFAHYAGNLKGIALIYEVINLVPFEVGYLIHPSVQSYNLGGCIEWLDGKFDNDMHIFLRKSSKWCYEKEYRLFHKPGIWSCGERGLKLRGILYTPRFNENEIKTLQEINHKHYQGNLFTQEIISWTGGKSFMVMRNERKVSIIEWLSSKLES